MKHIHPTAIVGPAVLLGEGVVIGAQAIIGGRTSLADGCWIGAGSHVGAPPEVASLALPEDWIGEPGEWGVVLDAGVIVREQVVVHAGSWRDTRVGAGSYVMNRAYIAHDVELAEAVTLSSGVALGGHVSVGERANIGMGAVVHQRRVIGALAMIGMGSAVTRDVPPLVTAYGVPARIAGLNVEGMRRAGVGVVPEGDLPDVVWRSGAPGLQRYAEWFTSRTSA